MTCRRSPEMVRPACESLARQIADDGEGATHFITIDVEGCQTPADARAIARAVADSPLVKTAIHGADPNWGRIVSAAGYAGVPFEEDELSLWINGVAGLSGRSCPCRSTRRSVSSSISRRSARFTCDLPLRDGSERRPLLDVRPDGRVHPAERGLHDVMPDRISGSLFGFAGEIAASDQFAPIAPARSHPARSRRILRPANEREDLTGAGLLCARLDRAASGPMSMKKTIKTLRLLGSGLAVAEFRRGGRQPDRPGGQLAKDGSSGSWDGDASGASCWPMADLIGVPVVMVMRMPRPLTPPASEAGPEFEAHLKRLGRAAGSQPARSGRAAIDPPTVATSRRRCGFSTTRPTSSSSRWRRRSS